MSNTWLHNGSVARAVLKGEKKSVPKQFCKKTACSSYVQPWLVAIGGWRLVAVGGGWRRFGWRLVVGGWWLAAGGWWRLAAVGDWQLVVGGGWRLAVGGSRRLAVAPWGRSVRVVLSKKKNGVP